MGQQIAITRQVSASIGKCELTHLERKPIDVGLARVQHEAYEQTLIRMGCHVISLPEEPELPDAVFVEDVALVLDELAVITRPGAVSRWGERESIATALEPYRKIVEIGNPGTLDGGDVLRLGRDLYVGSSGRTNAAGIQQLHSLIGPYGYSVNPVAVNGCLHLKSAVTQISPDLLLINKNWVNPQAFRGMRYLEVDPLEAYAANALLVNGNLVYPAAFPRTAQRIRQTGLTIQTVDISELAKAEGAVTCCSLILNSRD